MDTPLNAKAALLQALAVPGYGLELIERVRRGSAGLVRLRLGSVYPALRALEQERLVAVRPVSAPARGGRPRRYYELTLKGVQVAMAQREGLLDLLRGFRPPVVTDFSGEMRQRLESCSSVSGSVLELERRAQAAIGSRP